MLPSFFNCLKENWPSEQRSLTAEEKKTVDAVIVKNIVILRLINL